MPKVVSDPVLDLDLVVDPGAEPVDLDEAILDFLERFVERQLSMQRKQRHSAGTPAAELPISAPAAERQYCHDDAIRGQGRRRSTRRNLQG